MGLPEANCIDRASRDCEAGLCQGIAGAVFSKWGCLGHATGVLPRGVKALGLARAGTGGPRCSLAAWADQDTTKHRERLIARWRFASHE
jgi:hypothetical protein